MPLAANAIEQRSGDRKATGDTQVSHKTNAKKQLTYAAATVKYEDQTFAAYEPATFHKADKDNSYPFPYEDIPHLVMIGRYSGATLPRNEIVFMHIFQHGQAVTKAALHACRSYEIRAIRDRLGIALLQDQLGDPITMVTKRTNDSNEWHLIGDLRVRFPSKRSAISIYEQQRALCRSTGDGNQRLLTHDGHISPTLIPT